MPRRRSLRVAGQPGKDVVGQIAEGRPEHRSHEQGWREHAAGPTDGDGQADGDQLADQQQQQEPAGVVAPDPPLEDRIADAVHLR